MITTPFTQLKSHEIKKSISSLSPQKITAEVLDLQKNTDSTTSQKIIAAVQGLSETKQLEAIGRGIHAPFFLSIIEAIYQKQVAPNRLLPILVGLSPLVFFEMLQHLPNEQLDVLKMEGAFEPLQHHLTLFVKETEIQEEELLKAIEELERQMSHFYHADISFQEIKQMQEQIENSRLRYTQLLHTIDKALAITWNTSRIDLLDKLSKLKERSHLQLIRIGSSGSSTSPSLGLFAAMEEHLSCIFSSSSTHDIEVLQDDDPAIEALTKFSLWYPTDYWDIGLLPSIERREDLELSLKQQESHTSPNRLAILELVQKNLEKLGLRKVKDLKQAYIFSKRMLQEYIHQHKRRLMNSKE
jgi:hypothetical protein